MSSKSRLQTVALLSTPMESDKLTELYDETEKAFGFLPNAVLLFGLSPRLLTNQLDHMNHFRTHPSLGRKLTAFVRLLVAQHTDCQYCVDMNAAMLIKGGETADSIREAQDEPGQAVASGTRKSTSSVRSQGGPTDTYCIRRG